MHVICCVLNWSTHSRGLITIEGCEGTWPSSPGLVMTTTMTWEDTDVNKQTNKQNATYSPNVARIQHRLAGWTAVTFNNKSHASIYVRTHELCSFSSMEKWTSWSQSRSWVTQPRTRYVNVDESVPSGGWSQLRRRSWYSMRASWALQWGHES